MAVVAPAVALLVLSSVLVYWRVRADRLADLDTSMAGRAAAIAALVERDHGVWEIDIDPEDPPPGLVGPLSSWKVEADGAVLAEAGEPGAGDRAYREVLEVVSDDAGDDEDDAPAPGPAVVQVTVTQDRTPLDADLGALLWRLVLIGSVTSALALFAGLVLSGRVVGPIEAIARRAEAVREPSPEAPLPLAGTGDEIDRLAVSLNRAFARLHDAWARQARFTADASHELRTPLAVIRSSAEVALRRDRAAEEYREALASVVEGASRMQDTLDGLLLLARADAGVLPPLAGEVDVASVARDALDAARRLPDAAGLTLRLDAPAPQVVVGDAVQLGILLGNLLSNAIRHTKAGEVVVSVSGDDDEVVLAVRDTGEGIPPEALPHVFERFYRVDEARGRERGGSGLGLSIVDVIAAWHGGLARAESVLGAGTTITVRFPRP